MRDGFVVFDTHVHIGVAQHSGRRYTDCELLRDMDRAGIDHSVVIPFPVVDDYRAAHDEIGRAVGSHPERLIGTASMYPYIPERDFCAEVTRCREKYGFRALKVQPKYQPLDPTLSRNEFVFKAAVENGMAMICHTGAGVPFALPSMFMIPARAFPELKLVLAHCGGGGIFLGEAIVAALFCPNIYLELSSLMPHQVVEVVRQVASNRLMIGSDLPESLDVEIGKILALNITDAYKRAILSATALEVFGSLPR
jgi:predicted TIM-barrel fold metal-dependent hydrolase